MRGMQQHLRVRHGTHKRPDHIIYHASSSPSKSRHAEASPRWAAKKPLPVVMKGPAKVASQSMAIQAAKRERMIKARNVGASSGSGPSCGSDPRAERV